MCLADHDAAGFDSRGMFLTGDKREMVKPYRLQRFDVMGVLLNVGDPTVVNANTLTLFINGERHGQPISLPEHLMEKTLYPHIALKNAVVAVNFKYYANKRWRKKRFEVTTPTTPTLEVRYRFLPFAKWRRWSIA